MKPFFLTLLISGIFISQVYTQSPRVNTSNAYAVGTYESAGLYWKTSEAGACNVRYKESGNGAWKQGLELWFDPKDAEYRGSIIGLKPDTKYDVELSNSTLRKQLTFKTRNDKFAIGKTTILPEGESNKTIVINESGRPGAYHLVTVPQGSKSILNPIPVGHPYGRDMPLYDHGIEINADYVIVRGVEIRNSGIHGIIIRANRHDIVIEDCHIRFWGRMGGPWGAGNFLGDMDSGIYSEEGVKNVTIQRNLIADPRGSANDWSNGHPAGPQGISFRESGGGHVIRYNEIVSTEVHGFNDAIGGSRNGSDIGNLNRDSDVYGNIIRSAWDDAIESEGGNMNIRIWGNYLEKYYTGIATASTRKGPIYIFRNVLGECRKSHPEIGEGGKLFKPGGGEVHGRRYYFHNTALQPNGANHVAPGHHAHSNAFSRNNIYDVPGRLVSDQETEEPGNDYDYDFFSGTALGIAQEKHGFMAGQASNGARTFSVKGYTSAGANLYIPSPNLEFYLRSTLQSGDIHFLVKNPLRDAGAILPGFNDDFKGDGPDLGAFEFGAPPLEFGRRAYLENGDGWAPWEVY